MFRFSERLSNTGRVDARQYVKRAGLFAAGLVLLWVALQLVPSTHPQPPVYSDESGSVATSPRVRLVDSGPRLFSLGNLAAYALLVGGAIFAYVAHRRSKTSGNSSPMIEPLGTLAVGQAQQLRLVRCGGDVLLIGVTSNQITLLRDFDPDLFDGPPELDGDDGRGLNSSSLSSHASPRGSHFADVLRQYAGRYTNVQSNGTTC